jgi:serine/threonine protein kinase
MEIRVALKKLKSVDDPGYNVADAWKLEAEALYGIRPLKNPHLVRIITAFKRGDDHFIVLEWAEGGNLKEFWEKHSAPETRLSEDHQIRSYLLQIRGLTHALNHLHTNKLIRTMTGTTNAGDTSGGSLAAPKNAQGGTHMRHGDLKPENVLNFAKDSTELGTLKIADLGLAKVHYVETAQRVQSTKTKFGTIRYEPPQVSIAKNKPRSRLYDIWSMGCIIFESVIWLLYGYDDGLKPFWNYEETIENKSRDSLYFTTESATKAKISETVDNLMTFILEEDKRYSGGSPSMISDLLKLVRDKLLVVDLPPDDQKDPPQLPTRSSNGKRTHSDELLPAMQEIVKKAENSTYLASAKHRRLKIPPLLQSKNLSLPNSGKGGTSLSPSSLLVRFIQIIPYTLFLICKRSR